MTLEEKSRQIKQWAKELGFSACGITAARPIDEEKENFRRWLQQNFHGEMKYMERNVDKRLNPQLLVPGARSIIVVLMNYFPQHRLNLKQYKISKYAWGKDYHFVIKKRLWQLLKLMQENFPPVNGRAFVDSAPVLERYWAVQAGLGWIGKNSLLITRQGSYFFIGELIVATELAYDRPFEKNYCGGCTRCIDACPTGAIVRPHIVDARRCLSYLTIEKRGEFSGPVDLHNWVFGCDVCQDVCPWNTKARFTNIEDFTPNDYLKSLTDVDIEKLSPQQFKKAFKNTPVERTKYQGFMRNVYTVKENLEDKHEG